MKSIKNIFKVRYSYLYLIANIWQNLTFEANLGDMYINTCIYEVFI